jgi:insertion element IS1 protein InsB
MPTCPSCQSNNVKLNGHIHNGKQNHLCKDCRRQFVINPEKKNISEHEKALIDKLLLEKISLAGIARTLNISQTWLGTYLSDPSWGKGLPCARTIPLSLLGQV